MTIPFEKQVAMAEAGSEASPKDGTVQPILAVAHGDSALAFLYNREHNVPLTPESEMALIRKIDYTIMPILFGMYLLQFLDKLVMNFATVMGIKTDTNMSTQQYSYLSLAFYVAYLVCEPVHAYAMQRLPTAKYLCVMVMIWGAVLAATSACKTYAALVVTRALLGAFEAAAAPCLMVITTMWYKTREQPLRAGIWYCGSGTGGIIGGLISYGFQFYTRDDFHSWQIMFLVVGLITVVFGALAMLVLPDNPMTARWLDETQKYHAIERIRTNQTGIENKHFKVEQFLETWRDPNCCLLSLLMCAMCIPSGIMSSFQSIIITSVGFTSKESSLLFIASATVSIIAAIVVAVTSSRYNERCLSIVLLLGVGILGGCLMAFPPETAKAARMAGVFLSNATGSSIPIIYSLAQANTAGHTKKVTMNAFLLMAFAVGNIIGPLTFRNKDAPQFVPSKIAIVATCVFSACVALFIRYLCVWENRRRDRHRVARENEHNVDVEFADLTDRVNKEFRYSL